MKKFLLSLVFVLGAAAAVYAQPRAIGANIGYGASFSYQHDLGAANFLDVNVDLPFFAGIGGTVTYDWVDPFNAPVPWNEKGSWNWYLGVGAAGGFYGLFGPGLSGAFVGVAGHVGIAYDFWFPLQLSLDYRPNVGVHFGDNLGFNTGGLYSGISLGVRYRF
ncbi:MAG: hypothetical protein J6V13_02420 [Paludibacteraceae bacterium]|nr:hypothetical protein [Paludibacteraceae bacterium]MBO7259387.1 hypothetical protein [Paludibacteraceae bacterium]